MILRHLPSRWPLVISLTASLLVATIAAVISLDLRRSISLRANESATNLIRAMERDIGRNIELLGLSLQAIVEGVARPDVMALAPDLRRLVLFDRSTRASGLGAIIVFDREGRIAFDAAQDPPRSIPPVTDREYFQALRRNDPGLFISQPYVSRLIGVPVMGLSRRISRPDGSFGGVAHATIQLSYFRGLFDQLKLGPDAVVSLIRLDGTVIVRRSAGGAAVASVSSSPVFRRMRGEFDGRFVANSAFDGIERLYAFSRVGDTPLILSVAITTSSLYQEWFTKTVVVAASILLVCGVIVLLTSVLARQVATRARAERQLVDANAELSKLSRTDPLTGIGNRRSFDQDLAGALTPSESAKALAGLIVLDVDHFKRYNDLYGHPAGDLALRRIARLLAAATRDGGVSAYRIGGEEFALIVTGRQRGFSPRLAEALRQAVRAEQMPHAGADEGIVTISLGVSEMSVEAPSTLMASADAALYEAKRKGRDRVAIDDELPTCVERLRDILDPERCRTSDALSGERPSRASF